MCGEGKMACYDFTQKKIFGCNEGSLVWWHEKGHQCQHEMGITAEVGVFKYYGLLFCLCGLAINQGFMARAGLFGVLLLELSEEIAAWVYGINNWRSKSV